MMDGWRVVCEGCRFHTGGRVLVEQASPRQRRWRPYRGGLLYVNAPRRRVVHREMMENLERKAHKRGNDG